MLHFFRARPVWPACAALALSAALTPPVGAQTSPPPPLSETAAPSRQGPSLREALDAAWALSPPSRGADHRRAEAQARERAASSWINGSPSALIGQSTDRFNGNAGYREFVAELELPIWSPAVRDATQREAAAQREALEPQQLMARLKVAAEVREAAANVAMALTERDLAARKHGETLALARDVERRVKAGDSARVDGLQAQSLVQQAASARQLADAALSRQLNHWTALTGLSGAPVLDEAPPPASPAVGAGHPAIEAAQARARAARAKLALSEADLRDPMTVGIGATRERAAYGVASDTRVNLALKIPFGTDNRNGARIASARAEADEAQAELDAVQRQTRGDVASALAELDAARRAQAATAERARLAQEMQTLVARSYNLGESDLPTRLRADSERFEADLALARARVGAQRAISQLNQALGLLP